MVMGSKLLSRQTRRFAKEYELCQLIGRGSFGEVWVCRDRKTGSPFAGKLIDKTNLRTFAERQDVQREIAILEAFAGQHEGLVNLHEVLEGDSVVQLVMELCSGGDLFELLKDHGPLPECVARKLFRQLASTLSFCHDHGVVHRDVKPENILLSVPGQSLYDVESASDIMPPVKLKLADFGLAAILGPGGETTGYIGSRYYTAPEMLKGWSYGKAVDVWSMGVVLCTMLTGRLPFAGQNKHDIEGLRRAIVRGRVNFSQPAWLKVSDMAKALIARMLTVDPISRITAEEVLAHPWLADAVEKMQVSPPLHLSGRVSQSMPVSPVDTNRNDMDCHRPYGSAGAVKMSEFRLCPAAAEAAVVVVAEEGGRLVPPAFEAASTDDQGQAAEEAGAEGMESAVSRSPAPEVGAQVQNSSIHSNPLCCAGPLALGNLASAGVWCFPLVISSWVIGEGAEQTKDTRTVQPRQLGNVSTLSPRFVRDNGNVGNLKLGERHNCLAPAHGFYVR